MEAFPRIVRQIVLCVFSPLLGACVLAWVLLQLQSFKSRMWSKLGRSVCAGLVSLAIVCTTLIGKNTNGVNGVGGMHLMQFNPPAVQSVTPEDISNGWRVADVSDAGAFAPPPANAVTNERWRLRGAHDDAFRIPANGWSYPFASGVTVLSRGEIRKDIRSRDFPRAFEQDLSLLPVVKWQLLPAGRNESVFWHGSTPSNTLIATWWNAALGREATNPVCFQAELYTNGGFDYRYEDRTVRHVRVWPFDLDDDGLENSVDPDPLVAGPDAHDNPCQTRHTYGVGEKVDFTVTPSLTAINLRAVKSDITDRTTPYDIFSGIVPSAVPEAGTYLQVYDADASAQRVYICPATGKSPNITIAFNGVEYRPAMTVVEPSEVVSPTASGSWDIGFGHVGFGNLEVENFIAPFHVSFQGVRVAEIPCDDAIPPTGYFATDNYTGPLTHNADAGAQFQIRVQANNRWRQDSAGSNRVIDNWSEGTLVWKIPIGWLRLQSEGENDITGVIKCDYESYGNTNSRPLLIGGRADAYTQTFNIDSSGTTTLEKFGWRMTRSRWSFSGTVEKVNGR